MSTPGSSERPLLDVLAGLSPGMKRTSLRRLLENNRVRVNGRLVKMARLPIAPADRVEILPANARPERIPPRAARVPFRVVHADQDLLVIDKPAGLLTSTVPTEKRPTALAAARAWAAVERHGATVGLIHRLDRDASGLLVFSLNRDAFASLKRQFFDHSAHRVYAAVVDRPIHPPAGTIESRLVEYADGTVHSTRLPRGDQAITHYTTIAQRQVDAGGSRFLLRVTLETGRKHQIRTHLHQRGCPILGDTLYGGSPAPRLMLAAIELQLTHPRTGQRQAFQIPLPEPLAAQLR